MHIETQDAKIPIDAKEKFYRSDIDGLRAIAVGSVILFHLIPATIVRGFLGVDIFFVISGYLITSIVWRDINLSIFSFRYFYMRRLRRIAPVLVFIMLFTAFFALFVLLPTDLYGFGKSVIASVFNVPNIYFWRDTDYFARNAETKALLHLWSLGVEEQFYLLFPIILIMLAKAVPKFVVPVVVIISLFSLALNMVALAMGGSSPAFYLLPTRAWELGAGAIIALLPARISLTRHASSLLGIAGAALILLGLFFSWKASFFVPDAFGVVLGASFIILGGRNHAHPVGAILSSKALVFLGAISYSLYLWHWPIVVLLRYYLVRDLNASEIVWTLIAILCLSTASWYFIERPFRGKWLSNRIVIRSALAGATTLLALAAGIIVTGGFPSRLSSSAAKINAAVDNYYKCPLFDNIPFGNSRGCKLKLPSGNPADADIVLLGNSHAQMYSPVMQRIYQNTDKTLFLALVTACLPTPDVNISVACAKAATANLERVLEIGRAKIIVVGLTWNHPADALVDAKGTQLDNGENKALKKGLDDLIDRIKTAHKQVILIGPIAEPGYEMALALGRKIAFGHPITEVTSTPAKEFEARFSNVINYYSQREDLVFVRPDTIQCDIKTCHFLLDEHSLFADASHLAEAEMWRYEKIFSAAVAASQSKLLQQSK